MFLRIFFANFRKFSGVRGLRPPRTPYEAGHNLEPPEIISCVRHCSQTYTYIDWARLGCHTWAMQEKVWFRIKYFKKAHGSHLDFLILSKLSGCLRSRVPWCNGYFILSDLCYSHLCKSQALEISQGSRGARRGRVEAPPPPKPKNCCRRKMVLFSRAV